MISVRTARSTQYAIRITDLSHVSLIVKDLERSGWFYGEVLGMEEVPRPASFNFDGAWYRRGSAEIHLIQRNEAKQDPGDLPSYPETEVGRSRARHIGFAVEDLDEAVRVLNAYGVEIVLGPRPRGDGVTQMYCYDPDGHMVELHSWPPTGN
jgi:catechol 2,3-dioxygenase-like lactoylglutathione lyase family enzyme